MCRALPMLHALVQHGMACTTVIVCHCSCRSTSESRSNVVLGPVKCLNVFWKGSMGKLTHRWSGLESFRAKQSPIYCMNLLNLEHTRDCEHFLVVPNCGALTTSLQMYSNFGLNISENVVSKNFPILPPPTSQLLRHTSKPTIPKSFSERSRFFTPAAWPAIFKATDTTWNKQRKHGRNCWQFVETFFGLGENHGKSTLIQKPMNWPFGLWGDMFEPWSI